MSQDRPAVGFAPGHFTIDGYGEGGFRFGGLSHRGSIIGLPDGVHAWDVEKPSDITAESLGPVLSSPKGSVELLLIGTGSDLVPIPEPLRRKLKSAGIVVDPMSTGAAARTYNILLGERRRVAVALIAVA